MGSCRLHWNPEIQLSESARIPENAIIPSLYGLIVRRNFILIIAKPHPSEPRWIQFRYDAHFACIQSIERVPFINGYSKISSPRKSRFFWFFLVVQGCGNGSNSLWAAPRRTCVLLILRYGFVHLYRSRFSSTVMPLGRNGYAIDFQKAISWTGCMFVSNSNQHELLSMWNPVGSFLHERGSSSTTSPGSRIFASCPSLNSFTWFPSSLSMAHGLVESFTWTDFSRIPRGQGTTLLGHQILLQFKTQCIPHMSTARD